MPGIGEERITCHSLRHSREMHLLEVGVNPIYIRDVLGHSSVTTAEMYTKTDPEVKCRLMEEHGANYLVASRYTRSETTLHSDQGNRSDGRRLCEVDLPPELSHVGTTSHNRCLLITVEMSEHKKGK